MSFMTHNHYEMDTSDSQSSSDVQLATAVIARAVYDFVKAWENSNKQDTLNIQGQVHKRLYRDWEDCINFLNGKHAMSRFWFQAAGIIPYSIKVPAQFYRKLKTKNIKEVSVDRL